jgi:hypothetical protein
MYTDIILQTIRVAEIDNKRIQDRLMDEQMRIARMSRPTLSERVGQMLISIGERLQREPETRTTWQDGHGSLARTS